MSIYTVLSALVTADDYYGVRIGKFRNDEYSISGTIFYANESMLQIVGFNMDATNNGEILILFISQHLLRLYIFISAIKPRLFFSTGDASHPALNVYVVQKSPGGLYSKRM